MTAAVAPASSPMAGAGAMRNAPPPPFRARPDAKDHHDGDRWAYAWQHWDRQTAALRLRDREIEENIRFICGQQWMVWNHLTGRFVDATHWMTEEERRWRQRPVFNRIMAWFIYNHARTTENPPIISFLPGPDAIDAELANVMDIVWKFVWNTAGMVDNNDRIMAWALAAGRSYAVSRVDLQRGPLRVMQGPALLPVLNPMTGQPFIDPNTGQPMQEERPDVPLASDGSPLAYISAADGSLVPTGEPAFEREGEIVVDVLSPLECRGEWGPQPWHMKRWHATKSFLTPSEVKARWGVEVEANVRGVAADGAGELERLLFGAGYFGAANARVGADGAQTTLENEYVEVLSFWHAPDSGIPGYAQTNDTPGGRLLICTRDRVLYDGPRPLPFLYTSPIRCFDFLRVPGRPSGSSSIEMLKGPQKAYNRGAAVLMEHRNLLASPITVLDEGAGMAHVSVDNSPGQTISCTPRAGIDPIQYVSAPNLPADVWKFQDWVLSELNDLGNMQNSASLLPGRDASGELIKELRFNDDRYLGPFLRRAVEEFGRMAEDWRVIVPALYDRERVIQIAGEDNIAETVVIYPELIKQGNVNVTPDVESMLPEGRGERQQKVYRMWQDGAFGDPMLPEARDQYLSLARFPHLNRAMRQANPDREMASLMLGDIVSGKDPNAPELMVQPWFNTTIHVEVFRKFMASPKWRRCDPNVQAALAMRLQQLQALSTQQQMQASAAAYGMAPPPMPGTTQGLSGMPGGGSPMPGAPPVPPPGMAPPPAADPSHRPKSAANTPPPAPLTQVA